jgi:hypothetical protein
MASEKKDNSTKSDKREKIQFFDLFFGIFNIFVMVIMTLLTQKNLMFIILAYIFTILMLIGLFITYKVRNPFYIYFVYGPLLCGAFYALPGLILIPMENFSAGIFDYIIFICAILEIGYLIHITKNSTFLENFGRIANIGYSSRTGRAQYDATIQYAITDPEALQKQQEQALEQELKEKRKRKDFNKMYKRNSIILICVICVIGFYISYLIGL